APAPPVPWVTVNAAGVGQTITPSVVTADGARSTISQAPDYLLATGTYTLTPSGRVSTYTGLPPVATATGYSNDVGAFLACTLNQGYDEPFCQPKSGSTLYPGQTYYVTWAPTFFGENPDGAVALNIEVQGTANGILIHSVPASQGFYAWKIESDFLAPYKAVALNITFMLQQDDISTPDENDFTVQIGPTVTVATAGMGASGGSSGTSAVVIAVPVVVGLAVLLVAGLCVWSFRRHGTLPLVGTLGGGIKRRSSGYGVRQSRSERVGAGDAAAGVGGIRSDKPDARVGGIQLTDRDSWSPTAPSHPKLGDASIGQGRNVFREELQRQE
ncbi:hypothetical protein B0T26DRAFT_600575, partial [Lasiosphaeria miniovina]